MNDSGALAQKTAVRFGKTGPAIYHSHHDMIRFWERAVRRAGLPVRLTQGFNPIPRLVFPHALGLGIASRVEEVEIELHARVEIADLLERLRSAAAGALEILEAQNLPAVKKSRQIVASSYRVGGWSREAAKTLAAAAAEIMSRPEIRVERGRPGETRVVDIRPFLKNLSVAADGPTLIVDLIHTPTGSARPDEAAKLAAAAAGADWRDLAIEKTSMTLQ